MFLNPKKILEELKIFKFQKIADFGAGTGAFAKELYFHLYDDGEIYLFDLNQDVLNRAKNDIKENPIYDIEKFHFIKTDLEKEKATGLKNEIFDFVLISQLLFLVKEPEKILKEALRILKPNEKILVIDWRDSFNGLGPHKDMIVDEEKLKEIIKNLPLKIEKELNQGGFHYAYLLRKV